MHLTLVATLVWVGGAAAIPSQLHDPDPVDVKAASVDAHLSVHQREFREMDTNKDNYLEHQELAESFAHDWLPNEEDMAEYKRLLPSMEDNHNVSFTRLNSVALSAHLSLFSWLQPNPCTTIWQNMPERSW